MEPKILNQFTARAGILKALAHPSRLFMVDQLNTGPMCVADLKGLVGSDTSTVSKHLSVLHNAGIVTREKRRNQVFYGLRISCVMGFFNCVESVLDGQAQRTADLVKDLK